MEFIFWQKNFQDEDEYLVGHSRYWRSFQSHFGTANEAVLGKVLMTHQRQTIHSQQEKEVYQQFEHHLRRSHVTIMIDTYTVRVGQDFARLSKNELDQLLALAEETDDIEII